MSGKSKQVGKGTPPTKADKTKSSDKEELKKCKSELQKAKDKIVNLEGQNKNLQVRVLSFENNFNYEEVRRRLPELQDEDGLFATENARLVAEIKTIQAELEEIKKSKDSTSATQKTTVTVNVTQQSERHEAELKKKDGEISDLKKQVKELIELESKNEKLTKEVVEQREKIEQLKEEIEKWKTRQKSENDTITKSDIKRKDEQITALTDLTNKNTKLETTVADLKKELEQKTNKIDDLEKQKSELKEKPKNNDKSQLEKTNVDLTNELAEKSIQISKLESTNADLTKKLAEKSKQISQLEIANADLTKELAEKSKQIAGLEEETKRLNETIEINKKRNEGNVEGAKLPIQETTPLHSKELDDMIRNLSEANNEISELKKRVEGHETKLDDAQKDISSLKREKTNIETEIKNRERTIELLRKEKADIESEVKNKERTIEVLRKEKADIERKLSEIEKENIAKQNSLMREKSNLKERIKQLEIDKDDLEKKSTLTSLKASTKELEEENETLKRRLSQMAGAQLLTNNPNIADLSDSNRPTKLAEQYSELYDNEWTNAYEVLESRGKSETEIIKKLHERILGIYQHCSDLAKQYGEKLNAMVMGAEGKTIKDDDIPPTKLRQLKDVRKAFGPEMAETVIKKYMEKAPNEGENMNAYITKCVTLCWFMSVQDPPVVLDTKKHTGTFNGDIFKTYTKSGKKLDYVVWPPLYLHEGGPMLCKGVAQGK